MTHHTFQKPMLLLKRMAILGLRFQVPTVSHNNRFLIPASAAALILKHCSTFGLVTVASYR
jgi:hypothetical protein